MIVPERNPYLEPNPFKVAKDYRAMPRLRLMPLTMTMLALALALKVTDVYVGGAELAQAMAEEKTEPEKQEEKAEAPKEDGSEDTKKEKKNDKKEEEPKVENGEGKTTLKQIEATKERQALDRPNAVEVELLKSLGKRREQLDAREKEIELKTKVLDVTEKRIETRMEEMKKLQAELERTLKQYESQQDNEIKGLVKIYENMKPGDAATIFNELDMEILLSVIDKMSERKVAPVLAAMDPKRAKEVTEQLAELRKLRALNEQKMGLPPASVP